MNIHSLNSQPPTTIHNQIIHPCERIANTLFNLIKPILKKVPFFEQAVHLLFERPKPFTFKLENPYAADQVSELWKRFQNKHLPCIHTAKTVASNTSPEKAKQLFDFSTQLFLKLPFGWTIESLRNNHLLFIQLKTSIQNFQTIVPLNHSKKTVEAFKTVLSSNETIDQGAFKKVLVVYLDDAFEADRTILSKYLEIVQSFLSMPDYPFNSLVKKIETGLRETGRYIDHLKNHDSPFQTQPLNLDELEEALEGLNTRLKQSVTETALALKVCFIENGVFSMWESSLFNKMCKQVILVKHLTREMFFLPASALNSCLENPAETAVNDYIDRAIDELYGLLVIWKNLNEGHSGSTQLPLLNTDLDKSFEVALKKIQDVERHDMAFLLSIIHLWMKRQCEWIEIAEQFRSSVSERLNTITTFIENGHIDSLTTSIENFANQICNETKIDWAIQEHIILPFFPKAIIKKGQKICETLSHFDQFDAQAHQHYQENCPSLPSLAIPHWRKEELLFNIEKEALKRAQECLSLIEEIETTTQDHETLSPPKKLSISFLYGLLLTPTIHFMIRLATSQWTSGLWDEYNNGGNQSDIL